MDSPAPRPQSSIAQTDITLQQDSSWHHFRWTVVLFPATLWILLCWEWPHRLGFYSDDWMILLHPFVGTAEAFREIANAVATRPVSAPFIWLAQIFVNWDPARSQILNAAMLLVTAASIGMLSAALSLVIRPLRDGALVGASIASATFIVFPSTVGTFAWVTGVTTVIPAVPLFCLATSLLLHSEGRRWQLILGLALALLSHLSYEAFYFQEVNFIFLAAILRGERIRDLRWMTIIGAVLINVGCILFNRLTPGGVQKSFHGEFLQIFTSAYLRILVVLGHAVREHKFVILGSVLVSSLSGAICLSRVIGVSRVSLAVLSMLCGICASGILYAFAGYGLAAEGPPARVAIVLATYYCVAAGVITAAAWCAIGRHRLPAAMFGLSAVIGLMALELTARSRVNDWAETWSYEMARLSRLPAAMASAGGSQRIYVAIEDKDPTAVEPATAPYEITGAVAWAFYKVTNDRSLTRDLWQSTQTVPRWFAASHGWFNRWDGHNFEQGFCGSNAVIDSAQGSELWSWNTSTSELSKVEAPWEYGCRKPPQ